MVLGLVVPREPLVADDPPDDRPARGPGASIARPNSLSSSGLRSSNPQITLLSDRRSQYASRPQLVVLGRGTTQGSTTVQRACALHTVCLCTPREQNGEERRADQQGSAPLWAPRPTRACLPTCLTIQPNLRASGWTGEDGQAFGSRLARAADRQNQRRRRRRPTCIAPKHVQGSRPRPLTS